MKNLVNVLLLAIITALATAGAVGQYGWVKDAHNPVLTGGASGAWNYYVAEPSVLFNSDSSRYEMWFAGFTGLPGALDYRPYSIGFASSKDGISWTMSPSPVLSSTPGTWDAYTVEDPMVIRENGQYTMWYSSFLSLTSPGYIGRATSPDGIHWTKYSGNPVMGPGKAQWESGGPFTCDVIPFPGGYKMWYGASDSASLVGSIGYAESADGIAWRRDTVHNPVLTTGAPGYWDESVVALAQVLHIGTTYYMWFTGWAYGLSYRAVGVATSNDSGKTWTKEFTNPVLKPTNGKWDGTWLECGTVLQRGDTLHMWYDADVIPLSSNRYSIGHAKAPITGITEREGEVPQHFTLWQNYPNPFNPVTTIKFGLPKASAVSLTVFDVLGRKVSVLVNERRNAGVHEVRFDGSNLASGVYFYRLHAGDFVESKCLLLLR